MIVLTIQDGHHEDQHEILFPDGVVPMGWYPTNTIDGHFHGVFLEEDLQPGESRNLVTDGAIGEGPAGHAHEVVLTAVEVGVEAAEEEEDSESDLETNAMDDEEHDERFDEEIAREFRQSTPKGSVVETKSEGRLVEVKQSSRNGVPVGVVAGYLSTWDPDTGGRYGVPDQFIPGAFLDSLAEHRARGNRQVRLKDLHGRTIGGFPIESVREDEIGLFGIGEINLETQQGREAFSLARQGVLTDFSVGFVAIDDDIRPGLRTITKASILEASIVDEPANRGANILEVKAVVPFQDLPLADRDREWSSDAAINRVREFTGSQDEPSQSYREAFVWFDSDDSENFGAYKLPIADVIDGQLTAVPRAIFAAAAALEGARGGVDIPSEDRPKVIRHLERYYSKMEVDPPFGGGSEEDQEVLSVETLRTHTARQIERKLRSGVKLSASLAKVGAGILKTRFEEPSQEEPSQEEKSMGYDLDDMDAILENLRKATRDLRGKR